VGAAPVVHGDLADVRGLGVAQADAYSIVELTVVLTVVYLRRINVEEAALNDAYDAAYRAFAASRKRLFPGVY
jgi:protein-S-isoprenylcysteine O-methyltransferase Ste14